MKRVGDQSRSVPFPSAQEGKQVDVMNQTSTN